MTLFKIKNSHIFKGPIQEIWLPSVTLGVMTPYRYTLPALLLSLFVTISLSGQGIEKALNSLKEIHLMDPSRTKDSALVFQYNYLAEAFSGQQDQKALLYIDSIERMLPTSAWNKTEGLYYRAKGKYHDRRGEFEQALDNYTHAIESLEKNGDQSDLLAYTYILKAFVLNNNNLIEGCEQTLEQIRPLAEKLDNKNYLAWIIDWYGDRYFYSSYGTQDYSKALGYYLQVEELLPQVKNTMIKADNAHCLAGCYMRLGEKEKALYYQNLALEISKANNLHSVIFAVYGDMADVHEENGNFAEAIRYRLLSLDYAKQTKWIEMEARAQKNAAFTYKKSGDFENALIHFENLKSIEDSLSRFEVQSRYHELEAKYESGKKDLQIQQLKANNLQLILYVLAALLFGGLLFLIYYRNTNRKLINKNKELFEKNLEIQMALTEGQNIERKRMAIELHDNINAKIAAAKWVLETINSPEKSEEEQIVINRLVETMSDIYEDVRFISHNLVPKDIETKELSEIISQLVQNLNQNQKIKFHYTAEGDDAGMDNALKLQSYAMIMELIHNVIRHSGCRNAYIHLKFDNNRLTIRVEDDGKGFDPSLVHSGTGLKNLASRVNSVNGKIEISKHNSQGASIEIEIPVNKNTFQRPADARA